LIPDMRLQLQKHILPILVTTPDRVVQCIGSGFITVASGRKAHLVTAAHVVEEMRKVDNPHPKHHASAISEFLPIVHRFELRNARPRAVYFEGKKGHSATIEAAVEMPKVDIALCNISFDDDVGAEVLFTSRLALDTTPVRVGEEVIPIGYSRMATSPLHATEKTGEFNFEAGWESPSARVTAVYLDQGPTGQKGPCFQVNVPFKAGMSGGPIVSWDERAPYVRGFVMQGEERVEPARDNEAAPFALAGMIWPLMLMPVDLPRPDGSLHRERSLLDLEREGTIIDKGRAHDHVQCTRGGNLQITSARWE
jgi:hypothetical protein